MKCLGKQKKNQPGTIYVTKDSCNGPEIGRSVLKDSIYVMVLDSNEVKAAKTANKSLYVHVEHPDDSSARGNLISKEVRTAAVKAFCDRIAEAGYEPMIYGNTYTFAAMLDPRGISEYDVWYAFYNNYIYYPYEMSIWQYSTEAQVPGINGKVDMNLWFKD